MIKNCNNCGFAPHEKDDPPLQLKQGDRVIVCICASCFKNVKKFKLVIDQLSGSYFYDQYQALEVK